MSLNINPQSTQIILNSINCFTRIKQPYDTLNQQHHINSPHDSNQQLQVKDDHGSSDLGHSISAKLSEGATNTYGVFTNNHTTLKPSIPITNHNVQLAPPAHKINQLNHISKPNARMRGGHTMTARQVKFRCTNERWEHATPRSRKGIGEV